eukprot:jgi/Psemu1/57448/gm1.57448_g
MKIMQNHSIPLVAEKELYEWTRARVMKDIYATVRPEIEGDGFEPHLIDLCYKKLLGRNDLFFHAEDPTLPVRYLELQGNIDIDELHHSQWWINTWEKRCNKQHDTVIFNTLTWNSQPDAWETIYFYPAVTRDEGNKLINNVNNLHSGLHAGLSSLKDAYPFIGSYAYSRTNRSFLRGRMKVLTLSDFKSDLIFLFLVKSWLGKYFVPGPYLHIAVTIINRATIQ